MKYNTQKQIITATAISNTGLGFFSLLQLVFIVLKLCGVIHWSWIWVFMPTLLPIILVLVVCLGLILRCCVLHLFSKKNKNKK